MTAGGNLASIHSIGEMLAVKEAAVSKCGDDANYFIGLRHTNQLPGQTIRDSWGWTDSTPFDWHNWAKSEPSFEGRINSIEHNEVGDLIVGMPSSDSYLERYVRAII